MSIIEEYYKENYNNIVKRLTFRLGCREDAEDVAQDAFMRAHQYFDRCNVDFERWFSVILSNTCKDFTSNRYMQGMTKNIDDSIKELPLVESGHLDIILKKAISNLMATKSKEHQEVLSMINVCGHSINEVHIMTGQSVSNIKNITNRFQEEVSQLGV